jgi:hypothetical protein
MGRDTRYLTLALIVLCAFAAIIVAFPRAKKVNSSENIHAETEIEKNKSSELYADNTTSIPVEDKTTIDAAYNEISKGQVGGTTTTQPVAETPKPTKVTTQNVPDAYDELTSPKRTTEKFTKKGGDAKPLAKKDEKLNTNKLSGFLVVTNQFGAKDNALKEVATLKTKGYENANFITLDNKVFLAYAGWTSAKEDAVKLLNQLKKKGLKPIIKDLN